MEVCRVQAVPVGSSDDAESSESNPKRQLGSLRKSIYCGWVIWLIKMTACADQLGLVIRAVAVPVSECEVASVLVDFKPIRV